MRFEGISDVVTEDPENLEGQEHGEEKKSPLSNRPQNLGSAGESLSHQGMSAMMGIPPEQEVNSETENKEVPESIEEEKD